MEAPAWFCCKSFGFTGVLEEGRGFFGCGDDCGGASGARRLGLFDFRNKGAISLQLLSRWLFIACSSYSDTLRGLYFHLIDRQE